MTSDQSGSNLSFLDLMSCGFGGVLLLFFVIVIFKEPENFKDSIESQRDETPNIAPFLLLIHSEQEELFEGGGSLIGLPQSQNWKHSLRKNHVVVYGDMAPPIGTKLVIGPILDQADASFSLLLLKGGKVIKNYKNLSYKKIPPANRKPNHYIQVWPWPQQEGDG